MLNKQNRKPLSRWGSVKTNLKQAVRPGSCKVVWRTRESCIAVGSAAVRTPASSMVANGWSRAGCTTQGPARVLKIQGQLASMITWQLVSRKISWDKSDLMLVASSYIQVSWERVSCLLFSVPFNWWQLPFTRIQVIGWFYSRFLSCRWRLAHGWW